MSILTMKKFQTYSTCSSNKSHDKYYDNVKKVRQYVIPTIYLICIKSRDQRLESSARPNIMADQDVHVYD